MGKNVMILGVNGMLGSILFKYLYLKNDLNTFGGLRSRRNLINDLNMYKNKNIYETNLTDLDELKNLITSVNPQIVINCVGIVKQHPDSNNPIISISLNSLFPHKLHEICELAGIKLIQISTDCVFSGIKGFYNENDLPDPVDIYGKSKLLGEVNSGSALTLRTSYIGKELNTKRGLLSWFLSQTGRIKGYSKAIYSGLTTLEVARVIYEFVIPNQDLKGIYHLSSEPIDKFSLLNLIKDEYKKKLFIDKDTQYSINRSLNSSKFRIETGYEPLRWEKAIKEMKCFE